MVKQESGAGNLNEYEFPFMDILVTEVKDPLKSNRLPRINCCMAMEHKRMIDRLKHMAGYILFYRLKSGLYSVSRVLCFSTQHSL